MKILLLSCNTGGGHNSAAKAIQEILHERNVETELLDPICLQGEKIKNTVSDIYNNIIKNVPQLFGFIYQIGALYEVTPFPSPVYHANAVYAEKLYDYIVKNNFDCVICTHLYAMEAMTAVKTKFDSQIPCYGVLTDYTCIPFTSDTKLDGYFIADDAMKEEAIKKRLPADKIYAYGIPVSKKFSEQKIKEESRAILGLPQDKKIILVMFGSVGCEKLFGLCKQIEKFFKDDAQTYVIIGNNTKLKQKIEKKFLKKNIIPVEYTTDVHLYMNAADVLISKAGGLSSTEAAVANVPLVHLKTIPGCETKNAQFFAENGMSLATKSTKKAVTLTDKLMKEDGFSEKMLNAQRKKINPDAATNITDKIMEELIIKK